MTADTGGAVPELEKAKKSTDDLKTSAKAAGAEQKALSEEMKAGRAVLAECSIRQRCGIMDNSVLVEYS